MANSRASPRIGVEYSPCGAPISYTALLGPCNSGSVISETSSLFSDRNSPRESSSQCTTPRDDGDGRSHCFDFVLVLPMPHLVTEEEDERFAARHLTDEHPTYSDVIRQTVIPKAVRDALVIQDCETLGQAHNCVIELLETFFNSLAASLQSSLEICKFCSENNEFLFFCVKMSDAMSEVLADMDEYMVEIDLPALDMMHIKISDTSTLVPAYVPYDSVIKDHGLYRTREHPQIWGERRILRQVDHVRLLYDKIFDFVDLLELQRLGLVLGVMPDHHKGHLLELRQKWANLLYLCCVTQPINEVRDYFGEQVAFYFLFLGFMLEGLLVLMVPASCCMIAHLLGYKEQSRVAFCISIVMWSPGLVKFWARREMYYANKWGMDAENGGGGLKEPLNPDFHGSKKPSPLDENMMTLQPDKSQQVVGYVTSGVTCVLFLCVIVGGVAANRAWSSSIGSSYWKITGMALSAQIQLGEKIWDFLLVEPLGRLEQHTTLYSYDQSRVAKSFSIKFVNGCVAFLYMAYIQPQIDPDACGENCAEYLRGQLLFVFATYIAFGVLDVVIPLIQLKFTTFMENREARAHGYDIFKISLLEQQTLMATWTGSDEQDAYLAIMLPFGFVIMFGTHLPCMVFLCFLSYSFQLRMHAWKFTGLLRRTFPEPAKGIGTWSTILSWLVALGNLNCIGMMIVSVDEVCSLFPGFAYLADVLDIPINGRASKLLLFFFLQNLAIAWHRFIDIAINDETRLTRLEKARQALQRDRVGHQSDKKMHEQISLRCTGNIEQCAFNKCTPLKEGHRLYVSPIVHT